MREAPQNNLLCALYLPLHTTTPPRLNMSIKPPSSMSSRDIAALALIELSLGRPRDMTGKVEARTEPLGPVQQQGTAMPSSGSDSGVIKVSNSGEEDSGVQTRVLQQNTNFDTTMLDAKQQRQPEPDHDSRQTVHLLSQRLSWPVSAPAFVNAPVQDNVRASSEPILASPSSKRQLSYSSTLGSRDDTQMREWLTRSFNVSLLTTTRHAWTSLCARHG